MKCFEHREIDAVGVCRNCGRGLCSACAVAGKKLTCKGACTTELAALDLWIGRSRIREKWAFHGVAIVASAFALASLTTGALSADLATRLVFLGLGALFALLALVRIRQIRAWSRAHSAKGGAEQRKDTDQPADR